MATLAVQLYTLREFTKTPADIKTTLQRVKKMGYNAVQISAIGKIDPKELAGILKGEGLACCATHIGMDRMKNEPQAVIDEHKMWGCELTAIGGFFPKNEPTSVSKDTWVNFAKDYSEIAKKFAGSGVSIGYHNHSHEMAKFGGKTALEILLDNLSKDVWMEIDTYWITHGGGDPIQWINKCAGRIPAIHFKDMGIKLDRTQYMAEVGEGNLNFPGIIEAGNKVGAKWFIVEQDTCYRDPFESLEISLKHLKDMGAKA